MTAISPIHCILAMLAASENAASESMEPAVEAGRKALDGGWWHAYPWYDEASDVARPIDVSQPWYDKFDFWNWPEWPKWQGTGLSSSLHEWFAWIMIAVFLVVLTCLMIWAYRVRERTGRKAKTGEPKPDDIEDRRRTEALPTTLVIRPDELLVEATRLYQEGNYRRAIIYLFSHQLIELDKYQLIRLTKGKTNRQYVRELGTRRPLRHLVEQTMVTFEDVFFGNHAIGQTRFEACWSRLDEFNALVTGATS